MGARLSLSWGGVEEGGYMILATCYCARPFLCERFCSPTGVCGSDAAREVWRPRSCSPDLPTSSLPAGERTPPGMPSRGHLGVRRLPPPRKAAARRAPCPRGARRGGLARYPRLERASRSVAAEHSCPLATRRARVRDWGRGIGRADPIPAGAHAATQPSGSPRGRWRRGGARAAHMLICASRTVWIPCAAARRWEAALATTSSL